MQPRVKFCAAGTIIAFAVTYLISTGMRESAVYFQTVTEARANAVEPRGEGVRIKGKVRPGSIVWHPSELRLRFVLTDDRQEIPVTYRGLIPDRFADGREVIVEGRLTRDELSARAILTSCPSKYGPEDPAAAHLPS